MHSKSRWTTLCFRSEQQNNWFYPDGWNHRNQITAIDPIHSPLHSINASGCGQMDGRWLPKIMAAFSAAPAMGLQGCGGLSIWSYANGQVWIFTWWENKKRYFHCISSSTSTTESTLPVDDPLYGAHNPIDLRRPVNSSGTLRSIHVHLPIVRTAGWHIVGVCSNLLIVEHCRSIYDSLGQTPDTQGGVGTRNTAYANKSPDPMVSRVWCRYSGGANSTCHLAVGVMP